MSIPVAMAGQPALAKFAHETGVQLRMQAFVLVRDDADRIALQKLDGYDGWLMSGENLKLNESPDEAAERVSKTWYGTDLEPCLWRVLSFPATGGDDNKWYLVFLYEAPAPADLKTTPDCQELRFFAREETPDEWALAHDDIWNALRED